MSTAAVVAAMRKRAEDAGVTCPPKRNDATRHAAHQKEVRAATARVAECKDALLFDWSAAEQERRASVRRDIRGGLQQTKAYLVAHPKQDFGPTRRAKFVRDVDCSVETLHRLGVPFTRRKVREPSHGATEGAAAGHHKHPAEDWEDAHATYKGPSSPHRDGRSVRRNQKAGPSPLPRYMHNSSSNRAAMTPSPWLNRMAATAAPDERSATLDARLTRDQSPRRSGAKSVLNGHVHRAWFGRPLPPVVIGGSVVPMGDGAEIQDGDDPNGDSVNASQAGARKKKRIVADPTKLTSSVMRRIGVQPEITLHKGDGHLDKFALARDRAEYAAKLRARDDNQRRAALAALATSPKAPAAAEPPKPRASGAAFAQSLSQGELKRYVDDKLATVFVRGGNVGSYLRAAEKEAKNGLLKRDDRRSLKARLGGAM